MFTYRYKNSAYFIQGKINIQQVEVTHETRGNLGVFKSYRAAQVFITKQLKNG